MGDVCPMALVYKRSTKNSARRYERSSGMESNRRPRSNPGVNALTVVNSGRAPERGPDGRFLGRNPFQWIGGRKRSRRESPSYRSFRGAKAWGQRHPDAQKGRGRARLYATDEYGTILTKAIPKRLLSNPRRTGMAYNIGALRRAMRANYGAGGVDDPGASSLLAAARGIDTGRGSRPRRRHSQPTEKVSRGGMTIASRGRRRRKKSAGRRKTSSRKASRRRSSRKGSRRGSRRKSTRRGSKRRTSWKGHIFHRGITASRRARGARKAARTRAAKKRRRSLAAKKAARTRRRRSGKKSSRRRASRRGGRRRSSKAARRAAARRASRRRKSVRGSRRRSSRYFHGRRVRMTGRGYVDKYLARGLMPTVTRVGRMPLSRSGRPSIMTYPIGRSIGRLSRRSSVRGSSRRGYAIGATYRGRRRRRMAANTKYATANRRRRSRRNSRRRSSRRSSRRRGSRRRSTRNQMVNYATMTPNRRRRRSRRNSRRGSRRRLSSNILYATANRRRSRRNSRRRSSRRRMSRNVKYATANRRRRSRRNSRRRSSRRRVSRNQKYVLMNRRRRRSRRNSRRRGSRRRMTRNMLAVSKLRYRGSGTGRVGTPKGRYYQLVEYGPKSGRKFRRAGYPVLVPAHVSQHAYVRKYRFGGAAKDAHARARSSGYAERRRYSRWRKPPASWSRRSSKMTANKRRRSSRRRSSMRRNQKYVVMNRRRRRMRRNTGVAALLGGADLMQDVVTPVIGGTVGFIAARLLSNGVANVAQVRGLLDSGAVDAAGAANTKIAANLAAILATLGLSTKVDIVRKNRGALVTGMGLALTDRLIQRFSMGSAYAGYLGEYYEGIGEYVDQPMSGLGTMYAAAGVGEYVDQPMSGLGYAEGVDPANMATVDRTMNVMEAAAGSPMEAAAGMGVMYAAAGLGDEATMGEGEADAQLAAMYAKRQPPWVSTVMPVSGALPVTAELPLDRQVKGSLVTPEGKGFAGGLFARHLFGGMF